MRWERERRDWPHASASRFVEAGGITWHLQEWRPHESAPKPAPLCLLLHGTGGSAHSWAWLAPLLARQFRLIACDMPGHGFSTRPSSALGFSLPGYAALHRALIREIAEDPAFIIGHSAGAAVALQMHLDGLGLERIIGINAALIPFKGIAGQVFPALAKALVMNPFVPTLATWGASDRRVRGLLDSTGSEIPSESFRCYRRLFNDSAHVGAALSMMASWDLASLKRRWQDMSVPMHLIVGGKDGTVPPSDAEEIAAGMAFAQIHRLPGLGHLAHEEAPERVASIIEALTEARESAEV